MKSFTEDGFDFEWNDYDGGYGKIGVFVIGQDGRRGQIWARDSILDSEPKILKVRIKLDGRPQNKKLTRKQLSARWNKPRGETLSIQFTGAPYDFVKKEIVTCFECKRGLPPDETCESCKGTKQVENFYFDYAKFFSTLNSEEFELVKTRLKKKFRNPPLPVGVTGDHYPEDGAVLKPIQNVMVFTRAGCNGGAREFIEFSYDTAHSWAGPFIVRPELGGTEKQGCLALIRHEPDTIKGLVEPIKYKKLWPLSWSKEIAHLWPDPDTFNKVKYDLGDDYSAQEKIFDTLPDKVKHELYCVHLKYANSKEHLESFKPWKLYLYGNDDTSYSKWFWTKEELEKELRRLRRNQPCDFRRDISLRGYVFTN